MRKLVGMTEKMQVGERVRGNETPHMRVRAVGKKYTWKRGCGTGSMREH